LALLRPAHEVGLYGAAYKFVEISAVAPWAILNSIFPTMSRLLPNAKERAFRLAQRAFVAGVAAGVPIAILGVLLARQLIAISAGADYAGGAAGLMLLSPYLLINLMLTPALALLLAGHADRLILKINTVLLTLNVCLNLVFIPIYGYRAAAVITIVSEVASLCLYLGAAARRFQFHVELGQLPPILLAGAAMTGAAVLAPGPAVVRAVVATVIYVALLAIGARQLRGEILGIVRPGPTV